MNYFLDDKSEKPAYLQLYNQIKEDIVKGVYVYGKKIPSKRMMAEEVGVSTITIEHTYALLCDEGYIEARERSGYFVIFRATDGFMTSAEKVMDLHTYNNVHSQTSSMEFPFSVLARTMRRVMSDYAEAILEKCPNAGCIEFREAIRQYLARNRNIYVDREQIIVGSGAEYLYSLIVGILGRDKLYALEKPSYDKIEQVYKTSGVKCDFLTLGPDGIESSALAKTKAEVLHISPYRSFPTGITASASKMHEYVKWGEKQGHFIVEDDFESEFSVSTKPVETLFKLSKNDNVIYLNTFSKTISPALRVGFMVIPKCLVKIFYEKLGFYSCTVPTFEQFVLTELIIGGDFERHINRVRRAKRKELKNVKKQK